MPAKSFGPVPKACTGFVTVSRVANAMHLSAHVSLSEIDMPELKQASVQHIEDSLTSQNVMPEIFSAFASTHDEIFQLELKYVKAHWVSFIQGPRSLCS